MIQVGDNRVIKFDETLRYLRQKAKDTGFIDYNINDYELIPFVFSSGIYRVYKNFNFSIFVDDYCNADCKFCVAQLRYAHKNAMYNKPHIKDSDTYLNRLDYILRLIRPLNPSVSITGGEPTLSPILPNILKLVEKYGFRKRTITTNGSGLLRQCDGDYILNHLINNHWDHLNISRVSSDDIINKQIMRYNCEDSYCNMSMLKDILTVTNNSNLHHRLSCLLLKESVCSVHKMKKYIDDYANIGVNNFIFRELMDYNHTAINTEKMDYCDTNKVKLYDIWNQFSEYPEFVPYLNILGYYYYVEIYKYLGMTVASESADLKIQDREKIRNPNIVYEMVFHNNGNLCGGWVDSIEVLDKFQLPLS